MVTIIFLICACIMAIIVAIAYTNKTKREIENRQATEEWTPPAQLLDLETTTFGQRQQAYRHGIFQQMRYDQLQRQAEAQGDIQTLESIRLGNYDNDRLPIKRPDGTYTHYTSRLYDFTIAGINYRDRSKIKNCVGTFFARLIPEPTNEYDPNAISIIHEGNIHIGYIPGDQTKFVRSLTALPADCFGCIEESTDGDDGYQYFTGKITLEIHQN